MHAPGAGDEPRGAFEGPVGLKRQPKGVDIVGLPRQYVSDIGHNCLSLRAAPGHRQPDIALSPRSLDARTQKIEQLQFPHFATVSCALHYTVKSATSAEYLPEISDADLLHAARRGKRAAPKAMLTVGRPT